MQDQHNRYVWYSLKANFEADPQPNLLALMLMGAVAAIAEKVKNFAVFYLVDITEKKYLTSIKCEFVCDFEMLVEMLVVVNHRKFIWMYLKKSLKSNETCVFFVRRYELYNPYRVMFFFRNKHIIIDLGTSNSKKINRPLEDKQEKEGIVGTVYRNARKDRGLVVSPKDYSTKYRY